MTRTATRKKVKRPSPALAGGPQSRAEKMLPYFFAGPIFLFYALLVLLPLGHTFWLSLVEWKGVGAMTFVGLDNFVRIFRDNVALEALENNVIWVLLSVTVPVGIALLLAVLLAEKLPAGLRLFFTTVYYVPVVLALVVSALIWAWVYNPVWGLLNQTLKLTGLGSLTRAWLGDPQSALYAVFVVSAWAYFGFCLVILLAAVQNVDTSLYDAAKIDGANNWQSFRHVTIPSIRNELNFVVIYTAIAGFKVFDVVYIMTGGGPFYQTEVISTLVYRTAFVEHKVGYASAIAVLMTLVVATLSVLALRWRERAAS